MLHAPRRTRTPSLLIRSHLYSDAKRHAATRAVIPRRTRPAVYRNRRAASRPPRGTPTFTPTAHCGRFCRLGSPLGVARTRRSRNACGRFSGQQPRSAPRARPIWTRAKSGSLPVRRNSRVVRAIAASSLACIAEVSLNPGYSGEGSGLTSVPVYRAGAGTRCGQERDQFGADGAGTARDTEEWILRHTMPITFLPTRAVPGRPEEGRLPQCRFPPLPSPSPCLPRPASGWWSC